MEFHSIMYVYKMIHMEIIFVLFEWQVVLENKLKLKISYLQLMK